MSLIQIHQLSYRYPDQTQALADVSLQLADGERVGLVGPNGAGKSTLLWHLNGLLPDHHRAARRVSSSGAGQGSTPAVSIAGLAVTEENLPAIRQMVGLLFQDPDDQLFCSTVREDVAFGPVNLQLPRAEVATRVDAALASVGLAGFQPRVPHHLSLGERKRVCLAGVLACQPRLLALDEPTANLDPRARRQLLGILRELPCAQLVASHDLELIVELCPRVIVLDGGKIQADGPTREVLGNEPFLLAHGLELPYSLR